MILTRSTRLIQPTGPVGVDWQNVYAAGIEFAYIPGLTRDLTGKRGEIQTVGAGTSFLNGTMVTPGTNRNNGLILATGALLGPLQNSTLLAIVNTRAGLSLAGGSESDGLIGAGGNAIYSERAPTGNDIYKLALAATAGPSLNAEFTYRNDGATLLQQRVVITGSNDGRQLAVAAVKNGVSHSVYCNKVSASGTFGSGSSAFTNANIQRRLGSDVADVNSAWNGQILLVVGWSRALSSDEIAGAIDNPWQLFRPVQRRVYFDMGAGGGTSPVSSDQSASYAIRGSVSSDQAASYAIRSSVSTDLSASYNIQTASAVSSDLSSGYEIRTSAQSDVSAEYAIRASVQADASAAYIVRGDVLSDASASYVVLTNASADLSAAYEIQTASGVGASLDASYNVRAAVQSDASAAYDLRKSVGANSEHAFMVRGLVSSDLDASYTVDASLVPVYADMQAAYLVDGGAVFIPSQFVASVPSGVFSARAPAGEYSATVPAGNYRASI